MEIYDDTGCHYILDAGGYCGRSLKEASSYCPEHHAECYTPRGSDAEKLKLQHIGWLGKNAWRIKFGGAPARPG